MTAGSTGAPPTVPDPIALPEDPEEAGGARNETTAAIGVASWTLVSRVSGLVRVAVAGATLGPTFFANIFQATNTVPNITYNLMAGSLLATLVVPTLVEALDRGGPARARAVAQGLTGVVIVGFCAAGLAVIAAGPIIVHLLTIGIAAGPDANAARFQAWILLLLVVPQILLYGLSALGIAAQNAQRRFLLAAAAPTVENLGLIVTLLFAAHRFGSGFDNQDVPSGYLVVLGAGATLSVVAHAGLQLYGAARAGMPLRPRWGWSDPAVRDVARRAVPAMGTATVEASALFALIVAAGTVPGGVVALQIGLNFFNLPLAISARAVGTVMLPGLARDAVRGHMHSFAKAYRRALSTTWFIAVPAAVALVLLARPIAQALSFGKLERGNGIELVAVSIAALAPALLGGSTNEIARQASYARRNVVAPLVAGIAQLILILGGVLVAVVGFDGRSTLLVLGLAVAFAYLVQSLIVDRAALRDLPTLPGARWHALARHVLVSAVTIAPAAVAGRLLADADAGRATTIAGVAGGTVAGLIAYVGVQRLLKAPEVTSLRRSDGRSLRRSDDRSHGRSDGQSHGRSDDRSAGRSDDGTSLPTTATDAERTPAPVVARHGPLRDDAGVLIVAAVAAIVLGGASLFLGAKLALLLVVLALFGLVVARPVLAAYIYLALMPFVTGMVRGAIIPLLRPNEALQFFLTAAVLTGLYLRYLRGDTPHLTITRLDRALVMFATLASAWPLVWQLARSQMPTSADVMSTVPVWRFLALYALYRFVVREPKQVRRCMWILLTGSAVLGVIALLQSLNLIRLGTLWAPENPTDSAGRGNATLSSAIAVGDYLTCSIAVVLAWVLRSSTARRPLLYAIGGILLLGALGSGQFSAWIGTFIVVVLVAGREEKLRRFAARAAPIALVGLIVTWPVVGRRLAGFSSGYGLPSSWIGRVDNLTNFYLPRLAHYHWILGVRPDSILPAPETWREVIYLESGFLWFLWVGGIPLLIGAIWFFRVAMRQMRKAADVRTDDVGVLALATWAGLWVFALLSLIDMHLTLRGAGDLLFILLGLGSIRVLSPDGASSRPRPAAQARDPSLAMADP